MHGKEQVLAPLLRSHLGVSVSVAKAIDTDKFGTFSGEVERVLSPMQTARRKCDEGWELTGESLVLASEGSFGPHPSIGLFTANEEWLVLKDFDRALEWRVKVVSGRTNMMGQLLSEWKDVEAFASKAGFPAHALILRPGPDDIREIHKGITCWDDLRQSFKKFIRRYGKVFVQTDMRAHLNPTRMKVIQEVGEKLIELLLTACPVCESPGFDVAKVKRGLPCGLCSTPTQAVLAYERQCQVCGHQEEQFSPMKQKEDPMFCDQCNP
jgi:hypothetical protein